MFLVASVAFAQSDRGTITGTIMDPAGAMIPNASIEARNTETGALYETVSTETGNYTLAQLPAGMYQMSASVPGFKQFVRTGITVLVAATLRIDIQMEVGDISETVTVSADAPLLKTESGELAHNISTDRMNDLPLLSGTAGARDSYASINLLPGAAQQQGGFGTLRVNGMPGATLALRIEGQDATQTAWTTAYGMSQAGVDAIEETAIQTSNYAAEYGQAGGGVFNMTMRSGTNLFHGSAYLYFRNEALNAYPPYDDSAGQRTRDRDRRQNYGFTAGGPVYIPKVYDGRDKTFFFWSLEQNRQKSANVRIHTVPVQAYRDGDFSDPRLYTGTVLGQDVLGRDILEGTIYNPETRRTAIGLDGNPYIVSDPFMGCDGITPNVICQDPGSPNYVAFDPVAVAFQKLIPSPNDVGGNLVNNYNVSFPNKTTETIWSVKADHNLSSKIRVSGYYARNRIDIPFPDGYPPPITTERDLVEGTHTVRLNMDYTISPTALLHLGAGVMHFSFIDDVPNINYDNEVELGLPGTFTTRPPTFNGLNASQGGLSDPSGQGNSAGPIAQQNQWQTKPTGTANLTWIKGNHTYKFGGELRIESYPSATLTPANGWFTFSHLQTALPYLTSQNIGGSTIGLPYASFLLGEVQQGEIGQASKFHIGKHSLAFYAQDSWKITPKLTLDYGIRWDYQTYLREGHNRLPSFGYDVPNPAFDNIPGAVIFESSGDRFANNYPHAWGPRLGIAYQFMPKTVLRAGIGVSYGQTGNLEMWSLRFGSLDRYSSSTGLPVTQLECGPSVDCVPIVPVWPDTDTGSRPITQGDTFMTSVDRSAGRPPRQLQWSIGVQREITQNLSVDVSYVGNRGVWWMSNGALTDPNRVTPQILADHNLSLSDEDHRALLRSPLSSVSPADAAAYNLYAPYTGFVGSVSQSLRPYPHFGGIFVLWAPLGNTWYDALQVKLTKRYSHGIDFTAAYSWQKELTVGAETFDPAFAPAQPSINDLNDLRSNKVISGLSIPHRLVIGLNYTTPRLDIGKWASWLFRDWTLGAYLTYSSGAPIHVPDANNGIETLLSLCAPQSVFGGCNRSPWYKAPASHANRVPGEPLFTQDLNSSFDPFRTFVFNPDAWETPVDGEFGVSSAYYNDYRFRRVHNENLSLGRRFRFTEGMNLHLRVELMNAFNRVRIPNPGGPGVSNHLFPQTTNPDGTTAFGFGAIDAYGAGGQRTGQIVARFNF